MCIYNNKKCVYTYLCVWDCRDKYISATTPPQKKQKFLAPPLAIYNASLSLLLHLICSVVSRTMGVSETFFFFFLFPVVSRVGDHTHKTLLFLKKKKKNLYISIFLKKQS